MANTTISQLTSLTGSAVDDLDLLFIHDTSANIDKQISAGEFRTGMGIKPFQINVASSGAALSVTQTGVGNSLVIEDSTSPDSTPFIVNPAGNLIVGANTSYSLATDGGGQITPKIQVHGTNEATSGITSTIWSAGSGNASHIVMAKSHNTTVGVHTALLAGEDIGSLVWSGSDGVEFQAMAAIRGEAAATANTTSTPGKIVLATTSVGATIPTDKMIVTSEGNIGIGVTPSTNQRVAIAGNASGSAGVGYGLTLSPVFQTDVTTTAFNYTSSISTANSLALGTLHNYYAVQGTVGTGSTIGTQSGFTASSTLTGATTNYGFLGNLVAATGRWNLYMGGTAQNYIAGNLGIGITTPSVPLEVVGGIKGSSFIQGGYTALTAGATAMALGTNTIVKATPNATATYTTTVSPAGSRASIIVLTSGTTSYTVTFGTGFITTGTLATGTVSGKYFVINFVSDGTNMIEAGRTAAM